MSANGNFSLAKFGNGPENEMVAASWDVQADQMGRTLLVLHLHHSLFLAAPAIDRARHGLRFRMRCLGNADGDRLCAFDLSGTPLASGSPEVFRGPQRRSLPPIRAFSLKR